MVETGLTRTWDDRRIDGERYIDAGGERVVIRWTESGRAKTNGGPMSQDGITVNTGRDGLIIASLVRSDRDRALADLGLAE